ncbi:hypothetical protein [Pectinatus frisingensis]|uniref:hypothetical protein n=1 Tax=Pectinatus frisingensis TaxID=865 RepID=UPI0018C7CB74|nr:hypothetical protein [Pectinatus frisingensis]
MFNPIKKIKNYHDELMKTPKGQIKLSEICIAIALTIIISNVILFLIQTKPMLIQIVLFILILLLPVIM